MLDNYNKEKKIYSLRRINRVLSVFLIVILVFSSGVYQQIVHAEGVSAQLSLVTSKSELYPGKTFTVSLYFNPNMKVDITAFDAYLIYESSKISVVMDGDNPKFDVLANVSKDKFLLSSSISGNSLNVAGYDSTGTENPIPASGNTAICRLYFKVKEDAEVGSTSSFSIEPDTSFTDNNLDEIFLNFPSAKIINIGPKQSTVTYLSSLSPSKGTLSPSFNKTVQSYTLAVEDTVDKVDFTAKAESSKASVKITGGSSLDFGENTVTIKVTAEDPDFTRTYTIKVVRSSPPTPSPTMEEVSPTPEEISSSAESSQVSPTPSPSPTPVIAPVQEDGDAGLWKILTIIFGVLFLASSGVATWLAIDKVRNHDKIIKVKRV